MEVLARFDFGQLPLKRSTKQRLSAIDDSRLRYPRQKTFLADKLLAHSRDVQRGLYIPLTSHVGVPGKLTEGGNRLPHECSAGDGFPFAFFCNALLLPRENGGIEQPTLRATNSGFLVATIEHDPSTVEGLEEAIAWTAAEGLIFEIDGELKTYKDYAGFCAVWSGNKSVHLHFVFTTQHLINARSDLGADNRWAVFQENAAVMAAAHKTYFDTVCSLCTATLGSGMEPDMSLRSYAQYRRTPWGTRVLEKDSEILKLKAGTALPQLVLSEKIRVNRAAKGSSQFLVPPDIRGDLHRQSAQSSGDARNVAVGPQLRSELQLMCRIEWGRDYPKPVSMHRDRREWIINFQNHPTDKNPSTVCRGHHSTLLLQGNSAPEGVFRLPGELTANEMGNHLALRYGLMSPKTNAAPINASKGDGTYIEKLKRRSGRSFKQSHARDELRHIVGFSVADEISKLDQLKKSGSITDAEYGRLRAKLVQ